jgi:hypothetical protein
MNYPDYCPLCGAHQSEWDEGTATDEVVVKQEKKINNLVERLQVLTGELPPPKIDVGGSDE